MPVTKRLIRWWLSAFDSDGIDTTPYIEHLDREFEITIEEQAVGAIQTLGDMCDYVASLTRGHCRPLTSEEIWTCVQKITSIEFGVDARELHRRFRYVEDLNC